MTRILVVNSNTDVATTARVVDVVRGIAPDCTVDGRTAAFGPHGIGGRADVVISAHATLAALAAETEPVDGAIIACFSDPGLQACREVFDVPVVGIGEAAYHTACMLGGRFAVLTVSDRVAPQIEEFVAGHGLSSRLARVEILDAALLRDPDPAPAFAAAARDVVARHRAEVIVIGGAAFAGLPARMAAHVPVPVVGSVEAAAAQIVALTRLRPRAPATGSYARPAPKIMRGLDAALARLLGQGT